MLPRNNLAQQQAKRKCKEGDWVCVRCSNYNYAFRHVCKQLGNSGNRCRVQTKQDNESAISMMTHNNYGENSFPSALFITLDPLKLKEAKDYEKPGLGQDEYVLRQNNWLTNLIEE